MISLAILSTEIEQKGTTFVRSFIKKDASSAEQRQMRLLSTRTSVNDVAKHKNKGKRGWEVYEQRQFNFTWQSNMA